MPKSAFRLALGFWAFFALLIPTTTFAENLGEEVHELEEHMDEVAEETTTEHHGPIHLGEILQGEHSLEFWGAVVNFILLLIVLRMLLKKPLSNFLSGRQQSVEQGMKEAAEVKAKAQKIYDEYNERLKTMDADIEQLKQDIRAAAENDKKRILDEAKQNADRLRAETETLIAQQSRELAESIRAEVVEATIRTAEAVIRQALDGEQQERLAEQFRIALTDDRAETTGTYQPKLAVGGE